MSKRVVMIRAAAAGRIVMLAWLPMALAGVGVAFDEFRALGFTTWRSACRASGSSWRSIASFTLELLPSAVVGALLGGVLVLIVGLHDRRAFARGALAAHTGCAAAMPVGLLICATAQPWPLALAAELALAALAAGTVWWFTHIRKPTYAPAAARGMSRIHGGIPASENFITNNRWNSHDCH